MPHARVISVNVGRPRTVTWKNREVTTGIFKSPIQGPVRAAGVNLDGDGQADLTVRGGSDKAVYAFPIEHYPDWQPLYPKVDFGWGAFGENLSITGLLEDEVVIGARYRCGDAEFIVTQPRLPCFKLAIRMQSNDAVKRMLDTGHTGFYFRIGREGALQAGDDVQLLHRPEGGLPVSAITGFYRARDADPQKLRAAADAPGLPEEWRDWLSQRADALESR